jgi:hypothetical protein
MPCVSILKPVESLGDGGGVVSAMRPPLEWSSRFILGTANFGTLEDGDELELEESERLIFFAGGWSSLAGRSFWMAAGGERCDDDREL